MTTNIYDMADTWNDVGTTFNGIYMNFTDGAGGAPVGAAASRFFRLDSDGTAVFSVDSSGIMAASGFSHPTQTNSLFSWIGTSTLSWASFGTSYLRFSGDDPGLRIRNQLALCADVGTIDVILASDAANVLAQRNSTSAQTTRGYRTFTDASNYERWALQSGSGYFEFAAETAGTGTDNIDLRLTPAGTGSVTSTKNIVTSANVQGFDWIGGNNVQIGGTAFAYWNGRSQISSPVDGDFLLWNSAQNNFGLLQFGGTSSSFPAWKRSSTALQARLADDSGFAPLHLGATSAALQVGTHTAIGAETVTGYITIKDSGGTDRKIAVVS